MKKLQQQSAFTLVEVLLSTIIMSMMMVAVLGFIRHGAEIWRKSQEKIELNNYARMVFDLIKQEMYQAEAIYKDNLAGYSNYSGVTAAPESSKYLPADGAETDGLVYRRKITNWDSSKTKYAIFRIGVDPVNYTLNRTIQDGFIEADNSLSDTQTTNLFYKKRWNTKLARKVKSFKVYRTSPWALRVFLEFGEDSDDDDIEEDPDISTASHSMVLMLPQMPAM